MDEFSFLQFGGDSAPTSAQFRWCNPFGAGAYMQTLEAGQWPSPRAGTLQNFQLHVGTVITGNATCVVTLQVNGVSVLTLWTLTSASAATVEDFTSTVRIQKGDRISIMTFANNGTGTGPADFQFSCELVP